MLWLFYEKETETKGEVVLIYGVKPEDKSMYDGFIEIDKYEEPEHIHGKTSTLYCNPETKELWYEYEDRELTEQEKIQQLENALLEMSTMQAIKDIENEQAIMELTTMVSTMIGGI